MGASDSDGGLYEGISLRGREAGVDRTAHAYRGRAGAAELRQDTGKPGTSGPIAGRDIARWPIDRPAEPCAPPGRPAATRPRFAPTHAGRRFAR